MKLFQNNAGELNPVRAKQFKLEKDIQNLVEGNLNNLFSLQFVKSEFTVEKFRVDTLAFDSENNAFVIIEYKRDKTFSVIDQGYTYMSLLLNNKADFVLEYNENMPKPLKRNEIDWSQSRILFVSPKFTDYQKHSVNFKDVPFELWEIAAYDNGTVGLTQHKSSSKESITSVADNSDDVVSKVSREVKVYTEDHHFQQYKKMNDALPELYEELKLRLLALGDVELVPRKLYIGFKTNGKPFTDIVVQASGLLVMINLKIGDLDDPRSLTNDVSEKGRWGNGDYELKVKSQKDLEYALFLVEQAFNKISEG
jgi:predicted transport protein